MSFILNRLIIMVMFMFIESVLLPCERAYMYIKGRPQKVRSKNNFPKGLLIDDPPMVVLVLPNCLQWSVGVKLTRLLGVRGVACGGSSRQARKVHLARSEATIVSATRHY